MAELLVAGIEPVKRKKGWFELTIKGKPPFFIDEETLVKNSLRIGDIISDAKLRRIHEDADLAWLKYRGMQILSRRMISERDLRRKLSAERRPQALRDKALGILKEYGFYDDYKYAGALIRSQMARGVKSRMYLQKKLWEKGIAEDIATKALQVELAEVDIESAVFELAAKKYKTLRNLPLQKSKSRLINFLRGKGFSWDMIRRAVDEIVQDEEEDS